MAYQTIAHLAWRFRMWYENKRLLAAIAAPPLREIADELSHTANLIQGEKRPFVIYSCHDIVSTRDFWLSYRFKGIFNLLTLVVCLLDHPRVTVRHRRRFPY